MKGEKAPITSCYLDVDGRRVARHQDLEREVDILLKSARAKADGEESVETDFDRIRQLVGSGLDRSRTRGLAIFACSADRLWQVIELPVPVHARVVVNHVPAVGQLESVLREHEPIGVLLADRQQARMFVFELGELVERSELFEAVPRATGARGERDRGGDHPHALEEHTHQHLRTAAQVAFEVWSQHPFEHLAIAAPEHLAGHLEATCTPTCASAVRAPVGAGDGQPRRGAGRRPPGRGPGRAGPGGDGGRAPAHGGVGRPPGRGRARPGDRGAGRPPGRHAGRVQGLLGPGLALPSCDRLAAMGRRCKRCGGEMVEVDDLVEDVVEESLTQSCQLEICVGNADLDVMGRIGALLRY